MSFSAFEFLEKGELLEIPTEKPLSEDETWRSFRDVISGLEYRESLIYYCRSILLKIMIHAEVPSNPIIRSEFQ